MNENTSKTKAIVGIAAIVGASSCLTVCFFAIFSPENIAVSAWAVGALSLMGIALGKMVSGARA